MSEPNFLMVEPAHFEVSYSINPWMSPEAWAADSPALREAAIRSSGSLGDALRAAGASVTTMEGARGAPDLVFPANAAVVLDGVAVMARFANDERRVEEPLFLEAFRDMERRGLIDEVRLLPEDVVQEGAGDLVWDSSRGHFWAGHGQRSTLAGTEAVSEAFGRPHVALELATPRFYHLDTCFCPLPGGEILAYPPAFTEDGMRAILDLTGSDDLIVASDEDASRFCVNAVAFGTTVVMARAAPRLRDELSERGYGVVEVDLAPFIMSGGGAYCMTLRLDRSSGPWERAAA